MANRENCVLHHEVDKGQEFLQFAKFISLFTVLVDVEPALADV